MSSIVTLQEVEARYRAILTEDQIVQNTKSILELFDIVNQLNSVDKQYLDRFTLLFNNIRNLIDSDFELDLKITQLRQYFEDYKVFITSQQNTQDEQISLLNTSLDKYKLYNNNRITDLSSDLHNKDTLLLESITGVSARLTEVNTDLQSLLLSFMDNKATVTDKFVSVLENMSQITGDLQLFKQVTASALSMLEVKLTELFYTSIDLLKVSVQNTKTELFGNLSSLKNEFIESITALNTNVSILDRYAREDIPTSITDLRISLDNFVSSVNSELTNVATEIRDSLQSSIGNVSKEFSIQVSDTRTELQNSVTTAHDELTAYKETTQNNLNTSIAKVYQDITTVKEDILSVVPVLAQTKLQEIGLILTDKLTSLKEDITVDLSKVTTKMREDFENSVEAHVNDLEKFKLITENNLHTSSDTLQSSIGNVDTVLTAKLSEFKQVTLSNFGSHGVKLAEIEAKNNYHIVDSLVNNKQFKEGSLVYLKSEGTVYTYSGGKFSLLVNSTKSLYFRGLSAINFSNSVFFSDCTYVPINKSFILDCYVGTLFYGKVFAVYVNNRFEYPSLTDIRWTNIVVMLDFAYSSEVLG